jgi:hypothetical protein
VRRTGFCDEAIGGSLAQPACKLVPRGPAEENEWLIIHHDVRDVRASKQGLQPGKQPGELVGASPPGAWRSGCGSPSDLVSLQQPRNSGLEELPGGPSLWSTYRILGYP